MKDLPDLPHPLRSHSKSAHVGEMVQTPMPQKPQNTVCRTGWHPTSLEEIPRLPMPQRVSSISSISIVKGKGKETEQIPDIETTIGSPALKWPARTLTKGKQERKDSQSRPSVVGMFTADLLDFTSSEDEGMTGRSSTESDDTIR